MFGLRWGLSAVFSLVVDVVNGCVPDFVFGAVVAGFEPLVDFGFEEAEAFAVFVVRDTAEAYPVVDGGSGGFVWVVGAELVHIEPEVGFGVGVFLSFGDDGLEFFDFVDEGADDFRESVEGELFLLHFCVVLVVYDLAFRFGV